MSDPTSLPRAMTERERAVLAALLTVVEQPVADLVRDVEPVVAEHCRCGCLTIYFTSSDIEHWSLAEAYTTLEDAQELILFGNERELWSLEWVPYVEPYPAQLPDPALLTVWRPPQPSPS